MTISAEVSVSVSDGCDGEVVECRACLGGLIVGLKITKCEREGGIVRVVEGVVVALDMVSFPWS